MSLEGPMDPLKSFPYPSLSICLSSALGETYSLRGDEIASALDYTISFEPEKDPGLIKLAPTML
jgi:hypothetical protein